MRFSSMPRLDNEALRVQFGRLIATPAEAREELVRLTKQARESKV